MIMKKIGFAYIWMYMLVSVLGFSSCEVEDFTFRSTHTNEGLQVVGRLTTFSDRIVTSRGLKTNEESKISNMTLFIFDDMEKCIDFQHVNSANPVFEVDRELLEDVAEELEGNDGMEHGISSCKLYIVANVFNGLAEPRSIQAAKEQAIGKDLKEDFLTQSVSTSGISIPEKGFPMVGVLTDVDLTPNSTLPSDILEIPLEALYSKISFNVKVEPNQTSNQYISSFQLSSWEVHNIPTDVSVGAMTDDGQTVYFNQVHPQPYKSTVVTGSNPVSGSNMLEFFFYMPEHKVNSIDYEYPPNLPDEEKQRFKPLRKNSNGSPAFVRLNGVYSNHQGHRRAVQYDIYLGNDNFSNFQIDRNCQYNNFITIHGITNSVEGEGISIDHRVTITDVPLYTVWMERETQLDSHFEVRPVRVKLDKDFPANGKVVVSVLEPDATPWLRLEKKKSKREYFTTNLVTGTLAGGISAEVTPNDDNDDNCIWVYADENTATINTQSLTTLAAIDEAIEKKKRANREATIQVAYYADKNNAQPTKVEGYIFRQKDLYPVKSTTRTYRENGIDKPYIYYIEYFEEYLYNFDSDDSFGLIDEEGMQWGLDGELLSNKYKAAYVTSSDGDFWNWVASLFGWNQETFINNLGNEDENTFYDFYLTRDNPQMGTIRDYSGYDFTKEIVKTMGIDEDPLLLTQNPMSAIEYSYNKNKRSDGGLVTHLNWYLPSIDEIEDITKAAYIEFNVFQDKFYWSSQPSYFNYDLKVTGKVNYVVNIPLDASGAYSGDDINHARATKIKYVNGSYENENSENVGVKGLNTGTVSTGFWASNPKISFEYNDYNPSPDASTRDPGIKRRNEKCRIRTVYRP